MKKRNIYIFIAVFVLILSVAAVSFAVWSARFEQTSQNTIETGCFDFNFTGGEALTLEGLYPIDDEAGKLTQPYTFTVTNTCTIAASFKVVLNYTTGSTYLAENQIKTYVDGDQITTPSLLTSLPTSTVANGYQKARVVMTDTLQGASSQDANDGETKTYNLKIWMDENVGNEGSNKTFNTLVSIEATATK